MDHFMARTKIKFADDAPLVAYGESTLQTMMGHLHVSLACLQGFLISHQCQENCNFYPGRHRAMPHIKLDNKELN